MGEHFIHPCHCTEISADEYRRVAGMKPRDDRLEKFLLQKQELKALSDERIKKWPNTLKNMRDNKVKARKARIEKEEEDRRKQDVIDATFRAQRRREQLEKSNMMLLRPHIKELQFKAMMKEILKERELQSNCKDKMDELWKKKDRWWHEMLIRDYKRGVAEDEQEVQRRREKAIEVQKDQSQQLEERRQRFRKEIEDKRKEGERLKKLAADHDAAEEERDRLKRIHQIEVNHEFNNLNVELQARRDAEKEKLKLLDIQIAEYVAMKEKRDADNKAERDRIQNEKNARRDYMIDKLAAHLVACKLESDQRFGAEAQELRIAEDMREVLGAERRKHEWDICDRSRKQQIHLKKLQDDMEREDAKDTTHQVWQRVLEVQQMDEAEFDRVRKQNESLARDHRKQAADRREADRTERELEIAEAQNNWKKMEEDDEYIRNIDIFS